jgi:hypothetical protein
MEDHRGPDEEADRDRVRDVPVAVDVQGIGPKAPSGTHRGEDGQGHRDRVTTPGEGAFHPDHRPGEALPLLGEIARTHIDEVDPVPPCGQRPTVGQLGPLEPAACAEMVGDGHDAHAR